MKQSTFEALTVDEQSNVIQVQIETLKSIGAKFAELAKTVKNDPMNIKLGVSFCGGLF